MGRLSGVVSHNWRRVARAFYQLESSDKITYMFHRCLYDMRGALWCTFATMNILFNLFVFVVFLYVNLIIKIPN